MNFQYYRPGLVPMFGAAAPLIGQPIAPRGFLPAQGQIRPVLAPSAVAAQAAAAQGLLGAYPVGQAAMRLHQQQHAMLLASTPNSEQALMAAASPSPGVVSEVKDEKEMSLSPLTTPLGTSLTASVATPLAAPLTSMALYPGAAAPTMLAMAPPVWPDLHSRVQEADLVNSQYLMAQQMGAVPMAGSVLQHEVPQPVDTTVKLDKFNSDLHLKIDDDGYGGEPLINPPGFCFCWAGVRATYGVTHGKVCYEVFISEHLAVEFGDGHTETNPHVLRIGWSTDDSDLQLGEVANSYGYGGTGKFSSNSKFRNYGEVFGAGDVITALLDLETRPATVSYAKNGQWLGVACQLTEFQKGVSSAALFPHVLTKNSRFEVNVGQRAPWFPPPAGFLFPQQMLPQDLVRGMLPPVLKAECEIIMIVGLPGVGKTTWALKMAKDHPQKRYNIIGTDTLIDKMKVMGLPRKNNYSGRWEVLIDKASACLNKLFQIASKQNRHYILDQTNVYATARRRKLKPFAGFQRICAVLQTEDAELERRAWERTHQQGKFVPESAVMEMKANYSLPSEQDQHVDRIIWIELGLEQSQKLVEQYNQAAGHPARFKGQRGQQYAANQQPWPHQRDQDEISAKKARLEPGSGLDFIKQQYGDVHPPPPPTGPGGLTAWETQPVQYGDPAGYSRRQQGDKQMYEYGAGYADRLGGRDGTYTDYAAEPQKKEPTWPPPPPAKKDISANMPQSYWPQYGQEKGEQYSNEQANYDYYGGQYGTQEKSAAAPAALNQSDGRLTANRPDMAADSTNKSAREAYQNYCLDYWKQQGGGWGSNVQPPPPPPPDSPPRTDNWQQGSSNKPWQTDSCGSWQANSNKSWQADNSKPWQAESNKSWQAENKPWQNAPTSSSGFTDYSQNEMKDNDSRRNDKPRRSRWGPEAGSTPVSSSSDDWQSSQYESQLNMSQPDWQCRPAGPHEMSQANWPPKPTNRFGQQSSESGYNDNGSGDSSRNSDRFSRPVDLLDAQKKPFPESRDNSFQSRFSSNRDSDKDHQSRYDGSRDSERSSRYDRNRDSDRGSRSRFDSNRDMERNQYDSNRGSDRHSRNRSEGSRDSERNLRSRFDGNRDSDRNFPARYDDDKSQRSSSSGGDRKPDSFSDKGYQHRSPSSDRRLDSYSDRSVSGSRLPEQRTTQDERRRNNSDNRFSGQRGNFGDNRPRNERDSSRSGQRDGAADRQDIGTASRESRFDKPPPTSQPGMAMRCDIKQERNDPSMSGLPVENTSAGIKTESIDVKPEPLIKQEPIDNRPGLLGARPGLPSTGPRADFAAHQPRPGMAGPHRPGIPGPPRPGMPGPPRPGMPGPPRPGMPGPPRPGMPGPPRSAVPPSLPVPRPGMPRPEGPSSEVFPTPKLEVSEAANSMASNSGMLARSHASTDGPRPDIPGPRPGLIGPRPEIRGSRPMLHGPGPDIRGPRPDIRGPRPDMRGPRPEIGGLRPDIRGPRPDMRGPRPDMLGPRPDMRGPRPDMRGPRPDMRGPRPDMRGPRPGLNGPRPGIGGGPRPGLAGPPPGMGGVRPLLGPGRGFRHPEMMAGIRRGMGGPPGFRGPRPPFMR